MYHIAVTTPEDQSPIFGDITPKTVKWKKIGQTFVLTKQWVALKVAAPQPVDRRIDLGKAGPSRQ